MPTTSQILGWTPQEAAAAAFTASGEAGGGNDLGGVLQTIIARRALNPKSNVVSLVTAPQQFVANDRYTPQQVADPNFGQKVYGSRYAQALATLENPNLMSGFLQAGQGATSFRGQALLQNKHPDDIMFDKSGNFYFDKKPQVANQLIQVLGQPAPIGIASGSQLPAQQQQQQLSSQISPQDFATQYASMLKSYGVTPLNLSDMISATNQTIADSQAQQENPFSYTGNVEDVGYGIRPLIMAG